MASDLDIAIARARLKLKGKAGRDGTKMTARERIEAARAGTLEMQPGSAERAQAADIVTLDRMADKPPAVDIGGFLNHTGNAMMLDFGDEADAWLRSKFKGTEYADEHDTIQQQYRQYEENNPRGAIIGDIGGAVMPGALLAKAVGVPVKLAHKVGVGGLLGGVTGFGYGYGSGDETEAGRFGNALHAAGIGGLLGAASPLVGAGAGKAWEKVGPGAARKFRQVKKSLGLDKAAADFMAGVESMDQAFPMPSAARAGDDMLVAQRGYQAENVTRGLAYRLGAASSKVRQSVLNHTDKKAGEFTAALDEILGLPQGATRTKRLIMEHSAQGRREAYGAAYGQPIDYATDGGQNLLRLANRVPAGAWRKARELMQTEGADNFQRYARELPDGSFEIFEPPDVQTWDYIQRALNDMKSPLTGTGKDQGRAFQSLAREIKGEIDELVPEYGAARAAGRDAIANREALDLGNDIHKLDVDVVEDAVRGMSDAEKSYVRIGIRSEIDRAMGNVVGAMNDGNPDDLRVAWAALRKITSENYRKKVRAVLGDGPADQLFASSDEALAAMKLRATAQVGSATQPRQTVEDGLDAATPRSAGEMLEQGGLLSAGRSLVLGDPKAQRALAKDAVAEGVADLLMRPANEVAGALEVLPQIHQGAADASGRVARAATEAGLIGATVASGNPQKPIEGLLGLLGR